MITVETMPRRIPPLTGSEMLYAVPPAMFRVNVQMEDGTALTAVFSSFAALRAACDGMFNGIDAFFSETGIEIPAVQPERKTIVIRALHRDAE